MNVGVSGTREELTAAQQEVVRRAIVALPDGTTVIAGGCVGVDAYAARVAFKTGCLKVHVVLPADHKLVDPRWREYCHSHEQMPPGTGYRQRDARIVARSDWLLAFPLYDEHDGRSRRSGTWMTVRMARRAVKRVVLSVLGLLEGG